MYTAPRILVFTGEGKGKTTAALGMAVRAAGHDMPTLILQFLKSDDSTGELTAFPLLKCVEVRQTGLGFLPPPTSPKFEEHKQAAARGLQAAERALTSKRYRVVILDELCSAVALQLLPEESVLAVIKQAPPDCVVVLTGRNASQGIIGLADTVTEMHCVKHGYQEGHKARKGVEY